LQKTYASFSGKSFVFYDSISVDVENKRVAGIWSKCSTLRPANSRTCYRLSPKFWRVAMPVTVFVGISVDGFLARPDGTFDFLDVADGFPHGFEEFMKTVNAIVMGRNTYGVVQPVKPWPYGKRTRVVVLSSRPDEIEAPVSGGPIERMSGEPAELIAKLAESGAKHLYVDGGITIQRFLRAGLVDRMVLTRVPVLIGEGIPLFGSLPKDLKLKLIATRAFDNGMVQTEYEVVK
jgi:dihydrofolate reductase